ncbi:unnamed protein product [Mucor hiemalis]
MLRVYSILYLQQVWDRPSVKQFVSEEVVVTAHQDGDSFIPSIDNVTVVAAPHEVEDGEDLLYGTVKIVSSATNSTLCHSNKEQPPIDAPVSSKEEEHKENHLSITFDESSCSSISLNTSTNGKANSLISIPALPPSRSETPSTQHHEDFFSSPTTNSVLVLNNSKIEREYYEDDISSDSDEQEEAEERAFREKIASRRGSKFSPKRILHRAKSSINEESVKKIGRRTSLFLEKFNQLHQQQQPSSVSPLPPINSTPESPKTVILRKTFQEASEDNLQN